MLVDVNKYKPSSTSLASQRHDRIHVLFVVFSDSFLHKNMVVACEPSPVCWWGALMTSHNEYWCYLQVWCTCCWNTLWIDTTCTTLTCLPNWTRRSTLEPSPRWWLHPSSASSGCSSSLLCAQVKPLWKLITYTKATCYHIPHDCCWWKSLNLTQTGSSSVLSSRFVTDRINNKYK